MTLARWGIVPLLITILLAALVVLAVPWQPWGIVALGVVSPLVLFVAWFFRNPVRHSSAPADHLIAPSDGVVADVEEIDEPAFIGGRALRVGIFMSVFDVHVNRSPAVGTIKHADYHVGGFADVRNIEAKKNNESNTLGMEIEGGVKILVRQIAGLIARRIVCTHTVGDSLTRGEIFGMIRFGSRTEVWVDLKANPEALVKVGQCVKAGETAILKVNATK